MVVFLLLLCLVVGCWGEPTLTCSNITTVRITLDWDTVPNTDLYYVALVDNFTTNRIVSLRTAVSPPLVFDDLLAGRTYNFQLRSHLAAAPSIVQGWRNVSSSVTLNATCATKSNSLKEVKFIRRAEPNELLPHSIEIEWGIGKGDPAGDFLINYKPCDKSIQLTRTTRVRSTRIATTATCDVYSYVIDSLNQGSCYDVWVGDSDAIRLRTLQSGIQWKEMWRSSEGIDEVDFLLNHDTGDLKTEAGFLTSTNDGLFFTFSKVPVSKYCVQHTLVNNEYAPYTSCNAPEAGSRNHAADPICICGVYADRLIAHDSKQIFDDICVNATFYPNHTHSDPPCLCERNGVRSKYNIPQQSERFIGSTAVYLPYFYYQVPQDTYPDSVMLGYWYSLPRNGSCPEGAPLGTANPFNGLPCTWSRQQRVDVVYGSELLAGGWNDTPSHFWPLHDHGPNITNQILANEVVFANVAKNKLDSYLSDRCCGC